MKSVLNTTLTVFLSSIFINFFLFVGTTIKDISSSLSNKDHKHNHPKRETNYLQFDGQWQMANSIDKSNSNKT